MTETVFTYVDVRGLADDAVDALALPPRVADRLHDLTGLLAGGVRSYVHTKVAGARDVLPIVVGAVPFGMLFGALAAQSGIGLLATLLMSVIVYSGTMQLVGLNMVVAATPWPLVTLATVIVSSRHVFYSAALTLHVRDLPLRWRAALSYGMTDQIYALAERRYAATDGGTEKHWYVLGSSATLFAAWYASTWVGFGFGDVLKSVDGLGLDFAIYATLVALAAPVLDNFRSIAAGLTAGGVSLVLTPLPYQGGLFVAILAGIATGLLAERWPSSSRTRQPR